MTTKRKIILASLTLALLIGGGVVLALTRSDSNVRDGINYAPPTKADKAFNDSIKRDIEKKDTTSNENTGDTTKEAVTPIISAWGQPEGPGTEFVLNGYVPSVIENGGSCTLSLKRGGESVTGTSGAVVNAQSTSCSQVAIPFDQLSLGTWVAVLRYSSDKHDGSSQPNEVTVR